MTKQVNHWYYLVLGRGLQIWLWSRKVWMASDKLYMPVRREPRHQVSPFCCKFTLIENKFR